jgi:hypothetical protein
VGLVGKEFNYFNEQLSKEDYEEKINGLKLMDRNEIKKIRDEFEAFMSKYPRRAEHIVNCENSTGNYLRECKNCRNCFDIFG